MYYEPPLEDIRFALETFGYNEQLAGMERFSDFDMETCMELLESYSAFCLEVLQPLNAKGDKEGVCFDPETKEVHLPDGFKEAYQGFCENGFSAISMNPEYGGLGAPISLAISAQEVIGATNKSFSMCPGLNGGLIEALEAYGSDELKEPLFAQAYPR